MFLSTKNNCNEKDISLQNFIRKNHGNNENRRTVSRATVLYSVWRSREHHLTCKQFITGHINYYGYLKSLSSNMLKPIMNGIRDVTATFWVTCDLHTIDIIEFVGRYQCEMDNKFEFVSFV